MTEVPVPGCPSVVTRIVVATDGRIGVPDVVQYELTEGPQKGRVLSVPPTRVFYHTEGPRKGRRCGYAFLVHVHDHAKYDELRAAQWIYGERHFGFRGEVIDNRITS